MDVAARPEHIVTTDWLAEQLGRPGIRVVDARWRPDGSGGAVYAAGHLPGAFHVDWRNDLIDPEGSGDVLLLADATHVGTIAGSIGAVPGSTVIVYDDSQSLFAARVWWSLRTYDVGPVLILDGGFPAWEGEGRSVTTTEPTPSSGTVGLTGPNRMRVTTSDVRAMLGSPDVTLIDARAAAEYRGFEGNTKRLGHIPGAVNLPVGATGEPGSQRLRATAELRDRLHAANISRGRRMVCYDGSGVAAAKLAWVLTILGFEDVSVYDGGWAEWGNRLDLPVDR